MVAVVGRTCLAILTACGLTMLLGQQDARANVVFTVTNGQFFRDAAQEADGTLTGSFTTDNSLQTLVTFDLVASRFSGSSTSDIFSGFEYNPRNSTAMETAGQQLVFTGSNTSDLLQLVFSTPLTTAGATLNGLASFEAEGTNSRHVGGSVARSATFVPEPGSMAVFAVGVIGLGLIATTTGRAVGVTVRAWQRVIVRRLWGLAERAKTIPA